MYVILKLYNQTNDLDLKVEGSKETYISYSLSLSPAE